MVDRICISINNRCNLRCRYCHFCEKQDYIREEEMDVFEILDRVMHYISGRDIGVFKIGFVGNGEPLLDYPLLKSYLSYLSEYLESGRIAAYVITNGLLADREMLCFFKKYNVSLGFSLDGMAEIHDKYRCGTHAKVMEKIALYREVFGHDPSMNCTVGREILDRTEETIAFFEQFDTRVTFSRMIGRYGISLDEFHVFLAEAAKHLNVRTGGYDCTMYGGMCGAGMNNFFYANGNVYLCGNCVDLAPLGKSGMSFGELEALSLEFDRKHCYKETVCG